MSSMLNTTAGTLRAVLAFINPENTPKIAYDKDELAQPLIDKIKEYVRDRDGSQPCFISFNDNEDELKRQFNGVCKNIKSIFDQIEYCTREF